MAVLNINLRGEPVWPVVEVLRERRVPFLFLTGYPKSDQLQNTIWLEVAASSARPLFLYYDLRGGAWAAYGLAVAHVARHFRLAYRIVRRLDFACLSVQFRARRLYRRPTAITLHGADPNEVEFRDGVHGLCAWGFAVIIGALFLWATVTALASTRIGVAEASTPSEPGYLVFDLDRLFRADGRRSDDNLQASRAEAARIIRSGLGWRDLAGDDRAYLVRLVAARTGLSPPS